MHSFASPDIAKRFDDACGHIADHHPQIVRDILEVHFALADHAVATGDDADRFGPRNLGLLMTSLSRVEAGAASGQRLAAPEKCAAILVNLNRNRPFHSANLRTAYLATLYSLRGAGMTLSVPNTAFEDVLQKLGSGGLSHFARFRDLAKKDASTAEVKFLTHYLRQNTKSAETALRQVNYGALRSILERFGAWIEEAEDGQLKVMRTETVEAKRGFFGKTDATTTTREVLSMPLPGWTKPVSKSQLAQVREALDLTPAHGVDTAQFFEGVDALRVLVEVSDDSLQRLPED